MKMILLFCFILPILVSCGGGGGSSNPASTGVFIDSPVINISYRTETQNGVTNSRGEFKYHPGETVTFFIGPLEFPSVLAGAKVTPLDMAETDDVFHPMVVNISRLLQTLDKDGDTSNGITISDDARNHATQLDFDLPIRTFEIYARELITNGGQDSGVSELISVAEAALHLLRQGLLSALLESAPSFDEFVIGTWRGSSDDRSFVLLSVFEDGHYIHAVTGDLGLNEVPGMEWGTVSLDSQGFGTTTQNFDTNGSAGLSGPHSTDSPSWVFQTSPGQVIFPSGTFAEGRVVLVKIVSEGLLGTWVSTTTNAELLRLSFFEDNSYFQAIIDGNNPALMSGMELGTYSRDDSTGLLTVTQSFDNNGNAGFTTFVGMGAPDLFVQVSGDTLTLTMDNDGDSLIDETIEFTRQ
jgi:hypothetical protein